MHDGMLMVTNTSLVVNNFTLKNLRLRLWQHFYNTKMYTIISWFSFKKPRNVVSQSKAHCWCKSYFIDEHKCNYVELALIDFFSCREMFYVLPQKKVCSLFLFVLSHSYKQNTRKLNTRTSDKQTIYLWRISSSPLNFCKSSVIIFF